MAKKPTKTDETEPEPKKKRKPKIKVATDEQGEAILIPQTEIQRTWEQSRYALKRKVHIFYDLQRLRLQTAGRTVERKDNPIQIHPADMIVLQLRAQELEKAEKRALRDIADHLESIPFYKAVLSDKKRFRGIGPTMAGVILSEFDIYREETVSQSWSFAGLAPVPCRRCQACWVVVREVPESSPHYVQGVEAFEHVRAVKRPGTATAEEPPAARAKCRNGDIMPLSATVESGKAAKPVRGERHKYNAWLRSKLCGVLGPVMLKLSSPWRSFYDNYKHRKASAGWGVSDAHRHAAAIRYMIKMLLLEIWKEWRTHEGLVVRPPYQEQYLGHIHHSSQHSPTDNGVSPEEDDPLAQASIQAAMEDAS